MITVTDEVLEQMVEAIVKEVDPERVYLFGSHAKGRVDEDSDVDLLIVEREPFEPERSRFQELRRIRRALSSFFVAKDILVYSLSEFAQWRNSKYHVIGTCLREGRLLYARS